MNLKFKIPFYLIYFSYLTNFATESNTTISYASFSVETLPSDIINNCCDAAFIEACSRGNPNEILEWLELGYDLNSTYYVNETTQVTPIFAILTDPFINNARKYSLTAWLIYIGANPYVRSVNVIGPDRAYDYIKKFKKTDPNFKFLLRKIKKSTFPFAPTNNTDLFQLY